MKLLLISNSGRPYLQHCHEQIEKFLKGSKKVCFVASAAFLDPKAYVGKVQEALGDLPIEIELLDFASDPKKILSRSDAILVGGGNTYKLLRDVRKANLLGPIRERILSGMPYVGWSAGSNLAGPTILTTNDWNVVGLSDFGALDLVPFNINPHYKETDPTAAQFSETRDERIAEYHKANENVVLGIEEQTMLWVEGDKVRVVGTGRVRKFERDKLPVDYKSGSIIVL